MRERAAFVLSGPVAAFARMIETVPVPRDAQPIPAPLPDAPRRDPATSAIWIRIDGVWRIGHVQRWALLPDGWAAWLSWQAEPDHPSVAWRWGWFRYNPETVVERAGSPQPPDS